MSNDNPTSSYLWRNVIPHVRSVGRCIAPDLIGMGRSDKPDIGYRFVDHARYIEGFLEALGLDRITFVVHDWGSALGFDWAMRHESRVRGLAFMEAILGPVPSWEEFPPQGREIFQKLRTPGVGEPMVLDHNMFVEQLLPGSVVRSLSPAEMQHYRAPFVERAARKPMLAWPREIPIAGEPADVVAVVSRYRDALCQSQLPKLLFTVEPGMLVPAPLVARCRASLPKLDVIALGRGLHFVQEDHPHAIGEHLAAWVRRTRAGSTPSLVVGISMALPVVPTAALSAVPPSDIGKASGVNSTLQRFGSVFAVAVASAVFGAFGKLEAADTFLSGFRPALGVVGTLAFLASVTALAVTSGPSLRSDGRRGRRTQEEIGADTPFEDPIFSTKRSISSGTLQLAPPADSASPSPNQPSAGNGGGPKTRSCNHYHELERYQHRRREQ